MKKSKQKKKTEVLIKCAKGVSKVTFSFFNEGDFYTNVIKIKDNLIVKSQLQIKPNICRTTHEIKDKDTGRVIKWCITSNENKIKKWNY